MQFFDLKWAFLPKMGTDGHFAVLTPSAVVVIIQFVSAALAGTIEP
jgi:hypothetical protein